MPEALTARGGRLGRGRGLPRGRGRRFPNISLTRVPQAKRDLEGEGELARSESEEVHESIDEPVLETKEELDAFYQELVKAREVERKKAIAEGKMDDPLIPKRLEDAVSMVGTCMDMCPRFERYRREREGNLFQWEMILGTKRVDHKRAVKAYERAAGDKTLPSDLRPPAVLSKTLDYLFHDLLPRGGFSPTFGFIRDRSRAVRTDFTMQHESGPLTIECHDRCARFHILALHFERDNPGFVLAMEEQQLMYTLQSLKEFYEDQRGKYESPTELEMRVYHRLIHIRDQQERREDIPSHISDHPVFKLTTKFRLHVQAKSAPIKKSSPLIVDAEGMSIFGELATVLRQQGNVVMIYLVACILERLFGKDTIENIEAIRGDLSIPDIIDGYSGTDDLVHFPEESDLDMALDESPATVDTTPQSSSLKPSATEWPVTNFEPTPTPSVFNQSITQPSTFGSKSTTSDPSQPVQSAFSTLASVPNAFGSQSVFGGASFGQTASPTSVFGGSFAVANTLPSSDVPTAPQHTSSLPTPGFHAPPKPAPIAHNIFSSNIFSSAEKSFTSFASQPATNTPKASLSFPAPAVAPHDTSSQLASSGTSTIRPFSTPPSLDHNTSIFTPKVMPSINRTNEKEQQNHVLNFTPPPITPSTNHNTTNTPTSTPLSNGITEKTTPSNIFGRNRDKTITPPSRLVIDTSIVSPAAAVELPRTPLAQPPPLSKKQPVSLPTTPTLTTTPSFQKPPQLLRSLSKSNILQPSGISSTEILSPLQLSSPAKELPIDLGPKALSFWKKSLLVKSFACWQKRAADKAAWNEACRRSDAYRQKVQRERASSSTPQKRRLSSSVPESVPRQKRVRKRVSNTYQPLLTDEELVRRFKENIEEHERRWAQGSFLRVLTKHVNAPSQWGVWLSMNPDNDGTAIWLERKFNIPDSGRWQSENIFSIPLSHSNMLTTLYPGLIVFECTPTEGIEDELERKYRVLDDCTRLRDIIEVLPPDRHFIPSLLIVTWTDEKSANTPSDFTEMVMKLKTERIIQNSYIYSIASTNADLDTKFAETLKSLSLDTEGQLVQMLPLEDVFGLFEKSLRQFLSEWLDACFLEGEISWRLHSYVMEAEIGLFNTIASCVETTVGISVGNPLPPFGTDTIDDSETTYDATLAWLESIALNGDTRNFQTDLASHKELGSDFPCELFYENLRRLALQRAVGRDVKYLVQVPTSRRDPALLHLQTEIKSFSEKLRMVRAQIWTTQSIRGTNAASRRSSRRRSLSEDEDGTITRSPSFVKRMKMTPGSPGPSPSSSPPSQFNDHGSLTSRTSSPVSDAKKPLITAAMLRALTQDLKNKYSGRP